MSLKLTALVLTATVIGLLAWQNRDGDPARARLAPTAAARSIVDEEGSKALRNSPEEVVREDVSTPANPVADEPAPPSSAKAPGVFLTGSLSGSTDGFALSLNDLAEGLGQARFETQETGSTYEIDIRSYAPLDGQLPQHLWIRIDDPTLEQGQFLATMRDFPKDPGARRVEYHADLRLVRASARVTGRVVIEGNATAVKVAFQPKEEYQIEVEPDVYEEMGPTLEKIVVCAPDGRFEVPLRRARSGFLAIYVDHLRPRTIEIDFGDALHVDVGTVQLEPGHGIRGRVWWQGAPVAEGTLVYLRPEDGLEHQNLDTLHRHEEGFVHAFRSTQTGPDGSFEIDGLEEGAKYRIRVVPTRDGRYYLHREMPGIGTVVEAPAKDVLVECELLPLVIRVHHEDHPVSPSTLVRSKPDGSPLSIAYGGFAFLEEERPLEDGNYYLLAHPEEPFKLRIAATGFVTHEEVVTPQSFVGGERTIELQPVRMETVRLGLLHPEPARLEGLPVRVSLYGPGHPHGEHTEATVHAGVLSFELPPEHDYQVDLAPLFDPERLPGDQLVLLPMRTWVRGDRDQEFPVNTRSGALIEFDTSAVPNASEIVVELVGPGGEHLRVSEFFQASEEGSRLAPTLAEGGRSIAAHLLQPGEWELRITGSDSQDSIPLVLEAGEIELVELTP